MLILDFRGKPWIVQKLQVCPIFSLLQHQTIYLLLWKIEREEVEKAAWFKHPFQTEGKKGTDIFSVLHLIVESIAKTKKIAHSSMHLLLLVVNCFAWSSRKVYTPVSILFLFPVGSIEKVVCDYQAFPAKLNWLLSMVCNFQMPAAFITTPVGFVLQKSIKSCIMY